MSRATFFLPELGKLLLASSGQIPELLVAILPSTSAPPTTKNYAASKLIMLKTGNLGLFT